MSANNFKKYTGLIPAAYTPFSNRGVVNLEPIEALKDHYVANSAPAVFICGSTGESVSLSTAERLSIAQRWVDVARGEIDVIVHVGHNSGVDACELAANAQRAGAQAVAAMAPHYYIAQSLDDLVSFYKPVAAAASDLPFYFYDIPALTRVSFPADRFLEKAAAAMPNFAGIKYTSSDLMRLQSCLRAEEGRYDILYGQDENLLAGLALGVKGAVGSTYNYAAPLYQRIIDAFEQGDLDTARKLQYQSVQFIEVLIEHGVLPAGKAIMGMLGIDCGRTRLPVKQLADAEIDVLRSKLTRLGFFEDCVGHAARPSTNAAS